MAFISSLGNVLSSDSATSNTASTTGQVSSLPTSSSIQWPGIVGNNNAASFKNPFSAFAPPVSRESIVKAAKNHMMSAFSGLDLALDENGQVKSNVTPAKDSAARDLLASKVAEKKAEEDSAFCQKQKQDELLLAKIRQAAVTSNKPAAKMTALSQAIGSFHSEVEERDFVSNNQRRRNKGSQILSRRARQKKEKTKEKAEAYEGKQTNKSHRTMKRQQRKEKYKHVY